MDPISAVGIASAAVQFITFATQFISTTTKFYNSSCESQDFVSNLNTTQLQADKFYQILNTAFQEVSKQLTSGDSVFRDTPTLDHTAVQVSNTYGYSKQLEQEADNGTRELHRVYSVLQDVLQECQIESFHILKATKEMNGKDTKGSIRKSIKATLKVYAGEKKVRGAEEKLQRLQGQLTTAITTISHIYNVQHTRTLAALRRESLMIGAQHSQQLSELQKTLESFIKDRKPLQNSDISAELNLLQNRMGQFSITESRVGTELDIIQSLYFDMRDHRHTAIPEAHQQTFQWVFTPPGHQTECKNKTKQEAEAKLLHWLEHGDSIFWVTGKPGSGKSTFMKFIANHDKTKEVLSRWSHPDRPIISSCYFRSSGTEMQRSLIGLLRTLLHDIFRSRPELIRTACPSRWAAETSQKDEWTTKELHEILARISKQREAPYKICFFIDGLDKFNGDLYEFCENLKEIAKCNIKICLSSRPWNVFEDAFGAGSIPRITMHEMTWHDILQYTRDRLCTHSRWKALTSKSKMATSFAEEITKRAKGVFLWVVLVTKELREGLTEGDRFTDLERKLSSFPRELEPFFKQILDSVSPCYHEHMARMLKVALYATQPMDIMIYYFVDTEYDEEDYWQSLLPIEQSSEWFHDMASDTIRRINGHCRGLLEVQLGQVAFLHRTVADFLATAEMSKLLEKAHSKTFSPGMLILKAHVGWLKSSGLSNGAFTLYHGAKGQYGTVTKEDFQHTHLFVKIREAMKQALVLDQDPEVPKVKLDALVDEMDSIMNDMATTVDARFTEGFPDVYKYTYRLCRILALQLPLMGYLSRKLKSIPSFLWIFDQSPISVVLSDPFNSDATWPVASYEKLKLVLAAGSNPNESILGAMHPTTVWARFLTEILPQCSLKSLTAASPKFQTALEDGLIQILLEHGANPKVKIRLNAANTVSAFTLFAAAAFDLTWNKNVEEMYFKSLDLLIKGKASFDKNNNSPTQIWGLQETLIESQDEELGDYHDIVLSRLQKEIGRDEPGRKSFIARLVRETLPYARDANWPLQLYQHHLERAQSGDLYHDGCPKRGIEDMDFTQRNEHKRVKRSRGF
ncbi:unnamed protein product [Fusarium venenatum]|uniref:Uncharacterized protein n=1 Tax=Fusarium venenatum TaxID=56646 RepID=A0A2L2SZ58_9HYPO|nr:uncharacterized protein FVRRES_04659 [Fusarium venenatum]KAH6991815.1 hypothetical protein EDB82DRAFT_122076 [Fusarium venenatum]CEI60223.1 unnamed protein product [Fusarium venenatum]